MLHIVLVDDDLIQLEHMSAAIEWSCQQLDVLYTVTTYTSGEQLLFHLEDHPEWNMLFMDMQMSGQTGLDVARVIRSKGMDVDIVFATAFTEYAVESYDVDAIGYLVKPIEYDKVSAIIQKKLQRQPKKSEQQLFPTEDGMRNIVLDHILCMEAQGRTVRCQLTNEVLEIRLPFNECMNQLPPDRFVQIHRSYIVNVQYMKQLTKDSVVLTDHTTLPLSRRLAKSVQQQFIAYYKEKVFYESI